MPCVEKSPPLPWRLYAVALIAHTSTGAWITSASVVYSDLSKFGPALASAAIGATYFVSIVFAQASSLRWVRVALASLALSFFLQAIAPWLGLLATALAFGLLRPSLLATVGRSGRNHPAVFRRYLAVINLGYLAGGFLSDLVRVRLGAVPLLAGLGILTAFSCLGTLWLPPEPKAADAETTSEPFRWSGAIALLLAGNALCFFVLSQVATVLTVVAESQGGIRAGTFGGFHGALVLLFALFPFTPSSNHPMLGVVVGLTMWALAFAGLAFLPSVNPSSLLLLLVLISIGEATMVPSLLALGATTASAIGRAYYWIAATVGFLASGIFNWGWALHGRGWHFGIIAVCSGVLAMLGLAALFLRRPSQGGR